MAKQGKDLTKVAPRSPHVVLGGFNILARAIDKCQALLWGNIGEYNFDCPLDDYLFSFKGIKGDDFKKFVETGVTDDEIAKWVMDNGISKTPPEIEIWNAQMVVNNYSDDPESAAWLAGEVAKLNLPVGATFFDWLEADDVASFKK
ncbi:MAG: DUF5069 domain-containing protein [Candidatus Taylorbacteria bacterium]|nr:DUF5069 domain-containing protein [Candidatus Taylorbacteria bacterium]